MSENGEFHVRDIKELPLLPENRTEAVRQEMRRQALSSIYYLAKVVLGYTLLRPEPHGSLCAFMDFIENARENGRYDLNRSIIYMPRSTYKTTLATIARAIQRGLKNPNTRGLILADTGINATRFGAEISNHFKYNALLQWLFPEVIPPNFNEAKWNANEMVLRRTAHWREPTFDLMGAGGGIESRHYDWIIPDDLVTEKCIHSDAEMDRLTNWVGGLEPLLVNDMDSVIDFVGSRKKKNDTYEHIEAYYDIPGVRIDLGPHAIKQGALCIYSRGIREAGKIIFPHDPKKKSGISEAYLDRMRKNHPERYHAQMANDPKGGGLSIFNKKDFNEAYLNERGYLVHEGRGKETSNVRLAGLDLFLFFDPSLAERTTSSKQALIVAAKGSGPNRYILESRIGHFPPDTAIDLLLELNARWNPLVVSVEERGYQGSIKYWLYERVERENLIAPPLVPYPPAGSIRGQWAKPERIRALQPSFRAGYWYFVGGFEQHQDLIDELEYYPNVRWNDGLDCLAQSLEYFESASDEWEDQRSEKMEENYLERAGLLRIESEDEWNEDKWLASFDASGYAQRAFH